MGSQGIPDDLRPDDELPLDAVGALHTLHLRIGVLSEELDLLAQRIWDIYRAIKERQKDG